MSVEAQQRFEIVRLQEKVDNLQRLLHDSTSEVDNLRSSIMPGGESEQLQAVKAELDHERQRAKAIWAAIRHITGEETARRIEEEVSRRPIVAGPKARRRGTMPHMLTAHMPVVAKTAVAPKWPPTTQQEDAVAVAPEVVVEPIRAELAEETKSEYDVDIGSVPPSVARQLFGGTKGKDQNETATVTAESISLPVKRGGTPAPLSARVAEVASPMRRRESSSHTASVPLLPRPQTSQVQAEPLRQKVSIRSTTPGAPSIARRVSAETPPPPKICMESTAEASTPAMGSSVRDRIRQLELSTRRSSGLMI